MKARARVSKQRVDGCSRKEEKNKELLQGERAFKKASIKGGEREKTEWYDAKGEGKL